MQKGLSRLLGQRAQGQALRQRLGRMAGAAMRCLAVALLAGCVPALQPLKPDAGAVPAALSAALASGAATQLSGEPVADAHRVHWRSFFKDERLLRLIEAALDHNRDLRAAAARVEEARAQWSLVRAERMPLLQLGAQARLDHTYAEGLNFAPQRRLDIGASLASFELDFFGRLSSLSAAARANFLATEEARRATELALVSQIAELHHAQVQAGELFKRAQSSLATRERSLEIVMQARRIGVAQEIEVQAARLQLASVQAQVAQLRHLQTQTDSLMQLLAGRLPDDLPSAQPLDSLMTAYTMPFNLSAEVLLLRPDVVAAEQRLAGAQASVAAARAAFFPRVALTASAGTASAGLAELFKTGAWTFAPSISLPIFDGGRTKAGLDMAKAREAAVVAQYERTVQQAFREVTDQLSARESLAVQRQASELSLEAMRTRLTVQQQRHQAGMTGLLEVLDAERDLLSAEQSYVMTVRAELDAAVGLYRVLGGGAAPAASPLKAATAAAAQVPAGSKTVVERYGSQ